MTAATVYSLTNTTKRPRPWVKKVRRLFTVYIPILIVLIIMLLPFYMMAVTSIKSDPELFKKTVNPFIPTQPTLEHWTSLLQDTSFPQWFLNTTYIAVASTALTILVSIPAAYSLARLRYRGRSTLSGLIFVSYLIPTTLLFIPMAQVVSQLQLLNHREALIAVYPTFQIPFCVWLMIGYFRTIPIELEECAQIDGATRWQSLRLIALPLATPGIITAIIFAFTLAWNEFIYALVLVTAQSMRTIPVGVLTQLVQGDLYFWGPLMAAALLGSIPVVILFSFFVENYVAGLTAGAMKG